MIVTAAFLEGVAGQLKALAAALDDCACDASSMFESVDCRCDGLGAVWSGPRSRAVVGEARSYRATVAEFPAAVRSARDTVLRWMATAADLAVSLGRAEATVRRLVLDPARLAVDDDARKQLSAAYSDVDEIDALWQRHSNSYANELIDAIAAIDRANDAVAVAPADAAVLATMPPMDNPEAIAAWWADLTPISQLAVAAAALRAAPGLSIAVILAALEAARRDEAQWQAILDENDVPPGEFVSINTLQAPENYGTTREEGGWWLINMIHDAVADHIAESASIFLAPVAVEGESAGQHRTDVVAPINVDSALAEGVPYMIAEVKARGAKNRRDARKQLDVAEAWAEAQGAEVVRVGAPDENGEPQLDNPGTAAYGQLEFPTSGAFELYPGMWVVYRLSEPGVYEYRVYATEPLPDPDEPLDDDSSVAFKDQLEVDYWGQLVGRPTPANVLQEQQAVLEFPKPADEVYDYDQNDTDNDDTYEDHDANADVEEDEEDGDGEDDDEEQEMGHEDDEGVLSEDVR